METVPKPLTEKQERFIALLLADPDMRACVAYERAYGTGGPTSRSASSALMKDPRVAERLKERQTEVLERLELTAVDVLRDVFLVSTADANELTEHRIGCCRYCYGDGYQYQRTPAEYRRDLAAYIAFERMKKAGERDVDAFKFDVQGGVGFDPRKPPLDTCPECFGEGIGRTIIKDTRNLSEAGQALYAGVEETRHGLKINMRDKDKAREIAARHTGVVRSTMEHVGKGGGPIQHASAAVALTTTDPQAAAQEYQRIMSGTP